MPIPAGVADLPDLCACGALSIIEALVAKTRCGVLPRYLFYGDKTEHPTKKERESGHMVRLSYWCVRRFSACFGGQECSASLIGSRLLMATQRQIAARPHVIEGCIVRVAPNGGGKVERGFVVATESHKCLTGDKRAIGIGFVQVFQAASDLQGFLRALRDKQGGGFGAKGRLGVGICGQDAIKAGKGLFYLADFSQMAAFRVGSGAEKRRGVSDGWLPWPGRFYQAQATKWPLVIFGAGAVDELDFAKWAKMGDLSVAQACAARQRGGNLVHQQDRFLNERWRDFYQFQVGLGKFFHAVRVDPACLVFPFGDMQRDMARDVKGTGAFFPFGAAPAALRGRVNDHSVGDVQQDIDQPDGPVEIRQVSGVCDTDLNL